MAIKGLSKLVVGKYAYDESVVTYTNPQVVQKMVEYSLTLNQSENNPLYADNAEAENDKGTFQNGELSITTDDLTQEVSVMILGTKENDEVTYEQSKTVKEQVYDDTMNPPDLGVGLIECIRIRDLINIELSSFTRYFSMFQNRQQRQKGNR